MAHIISKTLPSGDIQAQEGIDKGHLEQEYTFDEVFFDTSYGLVCEHDFDSEEDLFAQDFEDSLQNTSLSLADKVSMDDDLIFMDLSDLITNDSAYDLANNNYDNLDILLGSKDAVHSVKDMFSNNEHAYMEMAVLGDNIQGHNMQEALHSIGITKNTDGSISLGQGWEASSHARNFSQYTHSESDTTLFVHQTLIVTG